MYISTITYNICIMMMNLYLNGEFSFKVHNRWYFWNHFLVRQTSLRTFLYNLQRQYYAKFCIEPMHKLPCKLIDFHFFEYWQFFCSFPNTNNIDVMKSMHNKTFYFYALLYQFCSYSDFIIYIVNIKCL